MSSTRLMFGVDTGGTFTDLVIAGLPGGLRVYKRPTTPREPIAGLLDVLQAAAVDLQSSIRALLQRGDVFVLGTTHATNAIIESSTARTALLVSAGHPDILTLREGGGRPSLFDYRHEYPTPYVPRSLTFEVSERIGSSGEVVVALDEHATEALIRDLAEHAVEAVAVCLLWSIVNPAHELRVGEMLRTHLPEIPFTLSHELNPTVREYRRASSAAIDASLKPLMSRFFGELERRLRAERFSGRLLVMTSAGGVLDADDVRRTPIHSIGSGPAAAPIAGRHFAGLDAGVQEVIVTDAGGTTYDVSLIRSGEIPWTRETLLGHATLGWITGFPSVDVRSVGAGGGSIGWVDEGGLLHVGPQSAGADPGPACWGRGGTHATVTDACVVLGYLDREYFLGGDMSIEPALARQAVMRNVAVPLALELQEAAAAVLQVATEQMVQAIQEITLAQGVDPTVAVMVAGGGGAGLYAGAIARRLGSKLALIPEASAALSATGTILSDLQADFAITSFTSTDRFDYDQVNRALGGLRYRSSAFGASADAGSTDVSLFAEARYPQQVWEIEVPLAVERFNGPRDVERFRQDFHRAHERLFAVHDPSSSVEVIGWRARARLKLGEIELAPARVVEAPSSNPRAVHYPGLGTLQTPVHRLEAIVPGRVIDGPAIIESAFTTVVVDPGGSAMRGRSGSLLLRPRSDGQPMSPREEELVDAASPE